MVNINSIHCDEIFDSMKQNLEKTSAPLSFISLMEYEQYLKSLNCDELKEHNHHRVKAPGENFEKKKIYDRVCRTKGCELSADDKLAIGFAIKYITKVVDELDHKGFVRVANILDETLQKFATKINCEDCE